MHWLEENQYRRIGGPLDSIVNSLIVSKVKADYPDQTELDDKHLARTDQGLYYQIQAYQDILRNAGIPQPLLVYATAQMMHETGNFSSPLLVLHNNGSGIKYVKQPFASGQSKGFATYKTLNDWAQDYRRVLSLKNRPIDATTAQDFYDRLHKNGYFTEKEALQYFNGLQAKIKKYNQVIGDQIKTGDAYKSGQLNTFSSGGQKMDAKSIKKNNIDFTAKHDIRKIQDSTGWFKKHPIWTGVAIAAAGIIFIKAVNN